MFHHCQNCLAQVFTFGTSFTGGDSSSVATELEDGVVDIFSTDFAFAALKDDRSVVTWGNAQLGGDSSAVASELQEGVAAIFSNWKVFIAVKESDGSLVCWGDAASGADLSGDAASATMISHVVGSNYALAAIDNEGRAYAWGNSQYGGSLEGNTWDLRTGVIGLYGTQRAIAALKVDGSVFTFGHSGYGDSVFDVWYETRSGVVDIIANGGAFTALKSDGSAIPWGSSNTGGEATLTTQEQLKSGVISVVSSDTVFAALKADGTVVAWGDVGNGGDTSPVADKLVDIVEIIPGGRAFAAITAAGSVVTWGYLANGGDSSSVSEELSEGVIRVFGNSGAFAAIKIDGTVVTWGKSAAGGDSSSVAELLAEGVSSIRPSSSSFAALMVDGSVVGWGSAKSDSGMQPLKTGCIKIFHSKDAYAVLRAPEMRLAGAATNSSCSTAYRCTSPLHATSIHDRGSRWLVETDMTITETWVIASPFLSLSGVEHPLGKAVLFCNVENGPCLHIVANDGGMGISYLTLTGRSPVLMKVSGSANVYIKHVTFDGSLVPTPPSIICLHASGVLAVYMGNITLQHFTSQETAIQANGVQFVAVENSVFFNISNTAGRGGAISVDDMRTIFLSDNDFSQISSIDGGGAVTVNNTHSVKIGGTYFHDCVTGRGSGGGAEILVVREVYFAASHFVRCGAPKGLGGGICVKVAPGQPHPNILLEGVVAVNNSAFVGGAIALSESSGIVGMPDAYIRDSTFNGNTAVERGGGISWDAQPAYSYREGVSLPIRGNRPRLIMEGSVFQGNIAQTGGGVDLVEVDVSVADTYFTNNQATVSGGGLAMVKSALVVLRGRFEDNTAGVSGAGHAVEIGAVGGGALAATTCAQPDIVLQDVIVRENTAAAGDGGGLLLFDCATQGLNVTVEGNWANNGNGGGIAMLLAASFVGNFLEVESNGAKISGGGIYCDRCFQLLLDQVHISGNWGHYGGGLAINSASGVISLQHVVLLENSAYGGGGLFAANAVVLLDEGNCSNNSAGEEPSQLWPQTGGGCVLLNASAQLSASTLTLAFNRGTFGGDVFLACGTTASLNHVISYSPTSRIGSSIYSQCDTTWSADRLLQHNVTLPAGAESIASGTSHGIVQWVAAEVYESFESEQPLFQAFLYAQNGRFVNEDNYTTCTISTAPSDLNVQLIGLTKVNAVAGILTVADIMFQGDANGELQLEVACNGYQEFTFALAVPVALPALQWLSESGKAFSSSNSDLLVIQPALALQVFAGDSPASTVSGMVCSIALSQNFSSVRLLGETTVVVNNAVATWSHLGVYGDFGTTVLLRATCITRSSQVLEAPSFAEVLVIEPRLSWSYVPLLTFLPSQAASPFTIPGLGLNSSVSALSLQRQLPCMVQVLTEEFRLSKEIRFTASFDDSDFYLPDFSLEAASLTILTSNVTVELQAVCTWVDGNTVRSKQLIFRLPKWDIAVEGGHHAFPLDASELQGKLALAPNPSLTVLKEERSWYLNSMTCTLSSEPPDALHHPENILTVPATWDEHYHHAVAPFRVRFASEGGSMVSVTSACEVNGVALGANTFNLQVINVSLEWHRVIDTWLPASGEFLPVISPGLELQVLGNGVPLNSTETVRCRIEIHRTMEDDSTAILRPPAGGYSGSTGSSVLTFDRVVISAEFNDTVALIAKCTRGLEELLSPLHELYFREPTVQLLSPSDNLLLSPNERFDVELQVLPDDSLSREHAGLICDLTNPNATIEAKAVQASNGSILFTGVSLRGILGATYLIDVNCRLGNLPISTIPTVIVTFEKCKPGFEPDSSQTSCSPCPRNGFSSGGLEPCRSCPPAGAECNSGHLLLTPGYFPADTRLLGTDMRESALSLSEDSVMYPCWNVEACALDSFTISCSSGYTGPLCGVCDEGLDYTRFGTSCAPC